MPLSLSVLSIKTCPCVSATLQGPTTITSRYTSLPFLAMGLVSPPPSASSTILVDYAAQFMQAVDSTAAYYAQPAVVGAAAASVQLAALVMLARALFEQSVLVRYDLHNPDQAGEVITRLVQAAVAVEAGCVGGGGGTTGAVPGAVKFTPQVGGRQRQRRKFCWVVVARGWRVVRG